MNAVHLLCSALISTFQLILSLNTLLLSLQDLVQTFVIWNTPEEEKEETTVSVIAAREISIDAIAAAFSSRMDGIFAIKEEQKMKPKAFLCGHHVWTSVWLNTTVHHCSPQDGDAYSNLAVTDLIDPLECDKQKVYLMNLQVWLSFFSGLFTRKIH